MNMQNHKNVLKKKKGFTLIEILVVIGIIAVLAAVVLEAVNPARQFKLARDSQRVSNVNALLNAIDQNMAEHGGIFTCGSTTLQIPILASMISDPTYTGAQDLDIAQCIVPAYISALPFDPSIGGAYYTDAQHYNTYYQVSQDVNGRITVSATGEITPSISVTR
jgi:prepilin-type N-terminal cleavage/methylation domain-containing protein